VIKFNTLLRVVYTLGVSLILSQYAFAQSVLNFARTTVDGATATNVGFGVMNPTTNFVDVQFTLYGFEGNPVSTGLVNPVSYRIPPKGQLSMLAGEIFGTAAADGWVQVTSSTSGLIGSFFSGDFVSTLEGLSPLPAYSVQVVPGIREDGVNTSELQVMNPNPFGGTVTITFYNARGDEAGSTVRSVTPHAELRVTTSSVVANASGIFSARISSTVPVAAVAAVRNSDSMMYATAQPVDQAASARIASTFVEGNGSHSTLVVTNPGSNAVTFTVRAFSQTGGPIHPSLVGVPPRSFTVPGNGSLFLDASTISGMPFAPSVNGWLTIESPNVALDGLVIVEEGQSVTALPVETRAQSAVLYSQISESDTLLATISLLNVSASSVKAQFTLVRQDGTLSTTRSIDISANSKFSALVHEIFPNRESSSGDYLFVTSGVPLYATEIIDISGGRALAGAMPSAIPDSFRPSQAPALPTITQVGPGTDVRPGTKLTISVSNWSGDGVLLLGDIPFPPTRLAAGFSVFTLDVPVIEAGFVNLRIRGTNGESAPVTLRILPGDDGPTQMLTGGAFYQKIPVTDTGLDLTHPVMVPIRGARLEVIDRSLQAIVAVSETDVNGQFRVPVPLEPDLTIRVVSRLRSGDLRVADNTSGNALYSITADVDARQTIGKVVIADNSRLSGAFNILEMIQRSNETVRVADATIIFPAVSIFWSTRNTPRGGNIPQGLVGTTYFNLTDNTAFVLGDRNVDSDEFDDSVIIHEYAHMLAARFSRDDSPGAAHGIGDMLDPRVAWSEGWANFFSSVVRNDAAFRDSLGPNGTTILKYDLEENVPAGDTNPGYWSEASVDSLLWDLYDDHPDAGDNVQYPLFVIWAAFTDLRSDRFVYFPYFLERFMGRAPESASTLQGMALLRSIDFQPQVRPSVSMPFPRSINVGDTVQGFVDSLTPRRTNLMQSAHFFTFTTNGGAAAIRLDITGLGPGGNANANDLDMFLMDANGKLINRSDRGLNGQSELISTPLPAGTYVVEIRSYYTKVETGAIVFNSGNYRLSVLIGGL
jgi:uncharacterized protein DUF5719